MSDEAPEASVGRAVWRNRLRLAGAAMVGAAAVGVCWLVLGGGGAGCSGEFPGVAWDPARGVPLPRQRPHRLVPRATPRRRGNNRDVVPGGHADKDASVGASGASVGASASEQSAAQLSLTVTNQSRFTSLLGLLHADGFLHTINMSAPDALVRQQFASVRPGTFVKLSYCQLKLPTYVQAADCKWPDLSGRRDSNSGPPVPQTSALTRLRYAPPTATR